ncbi:SMI1/KNR4 family protein [Kineosporia succinea]|uniref:Knr4/Smi1-like domain-containing protein n=1 Tax=Kineosporia succinea TaxID=84632 RepID=A0ABT9P2M0_9ACTN|nr:SMI1/KNR4 family protein [Kineosporia succinea]MDP9826928.1 hypothetical protein [Kineosporia succinea]
MSPTSTTQWQRYLARLDEQPHRKATEEDLTRARQRLGTDLPESLANLLRETDGWPHPGVLHGLCSTTELRWTSDPTHDLVDAWTSFEEIVEVIAGCLVVVDGGDGRYCLLDASRTGDDGEWIAYDWGAGDGEDPVPYPSLSALVDDLTTR